MGEAGKVDPLEPIAATSIGKSDQPTVLSKELYAESTVVKSALVFPGGSCPIAPEKPQLGGCKLPQTMSRVTSRWFRMSVVDVFGLPLWWIYLLGC